MKIDYIHFYVADAIASCNWFVNHMGFQAVASGANHHTHTTVVRSGEIFLVLSSPLSATSPVAHFLRLHPPGVADVAFVVSDLASVMERAVARGAKVLEPVQQQLSAERCKWGKIAAWGSLSHTLIERHSNICRLPAFVDLEIVVPPSFLATSPVAEPSLFTGIDHVVLNVATGDLARALAWYEEVLGFQRQQKYTIETNYSGLRSQVMVHPTSGVQFPINEPTSANSQIQEFLDLNQGSGIQHIALQTSQIVQAIAKLRQRGLSFLPIPASYYTQLQHQSWLPLSPTELIEITAQQVLVDWQEQFPQSLLLQTFTQPIFSEPTFFFELIERRQAAQGFGEGNFRALFEAIEREQMKRGSLELK